MRDEGKTHQQIADELTRRLGERVARSSVSSAIARAGGSGTKPRHDKVVPWRVPQRFAMEYPVRMLRLLGRRQSGLEMSEQDASRLDAWLNELAENDHVVVFCPDAPEGKPGFYYVPSEARDHDDMDLPIRREPVTPRQIGY